VTSSMPCGPSEIGSAWMTTRRAARTRRSTCARRSSPGLGPCGSRSR
jgi:hypothetical protein